MNPQALMDGLITGSMIGLGAIGVTLTYSILRFANFAHGEFIAWGAYFALAVAGALGAMSGALLAPIGPFSFGWALPIGALAAIALTGGLALLVDALLFGRLRDRKSTVIIMVMASFGAALTLRSLLEFIFTSKPAYYTQALQIALPLGGGLRATPDQLLSLGVSAVLVVAVHLLLTRTAIGRSMRAVSENPQLAGVVGIEVRQVIRVVWLLGAGLACVAGISAGLLVQIRPQMGLDLLAAAVCRGDPRRHRQRARRDARRADRRPHRSVRGAADRRGMARRDRLRHPGAGAALAPAGPVREGRMSVELVGYACFFLTMALTYAIMCLGLNVQWGQTGLFNVGVAGFVAIGAYVSALLTTPDAANRLGGFDLPIALGWLGGALAAGLVSFLIGALTIRLRADYLAIATFGVAVTVHLVALNAEPVTGGPFGIGFIPRPFAGAGRRSRCCSACSISACWLSSSSPFTSRWNGCCAARGAACCGPSAKTRPRPARSARARHNSGCRRSPSAAASWGWQAPRRRISSASSRPTITCRC